MTAGKAADLDAVADFEPGVLPSRIIIACPRREDDDAEAPLHQLGGRIVHVLPDGRWIWNVNLADDDKRWWRVHRGASGTVVWEFSGGGGRSRLANRPGRLAGHNGRGRHVPGDDAASGDDGVGADFHSSQDQRPCSNPCPVADLDRADDQVERGLMIVVAPVQT